VPDYPSGMGFAADRVGASPAGWAGHRAAEPQSPRRALAAAALCVAGLVIVWVLANLLPVGHRGDALALRDFTLLERAPMNSPASLLLNLLEPLPFILWSALLVAVALRRGLRWRALAVALVAGLAPLTTELLKPLVAHAHSPLSGWDIAPASWPSGHATAAMALALCALLVAPRRLRGLVAAVGGLFTVAVAYSLLVLAWHMPSDVVGGFLVAALWVSLAVAGLRLLEGPRPGERSEPARDRRARGPGRTRWAPGAQRRPVVYYPAGRLAGLTGAGLALVLGMLAVLGAEQLAELDHRALLLAGAGIAALAGTIFAALTAALER
jgi:membrane-associated phospholipid phosphatase